MTTYTDDGQGLGSCLVMIVLILLFLGRVNTYTRTRPPYQQLGEWDEENQYMDGSPAPGTRHVIEIQGDRDDAARITAGQTPQGDRSWVHTHTGYYRWQISAQDWSKGPPPKPDGVSWNDYYSALHKAGFRRDKGTNDLRRE